MRKMGLNKNYIVGIFDDPEFSSQYNTQQKRKELSEFFTRFKYFGKILYGKSVNDVLDQALEYDVDFCIVQSIGHIIKEAHFFFWIEKWIENKNFFVTGHILDRQTTTEKNGYYGLHHQCLLVNLNYYKKFDKPVFGYMGSKNVEVADAVRHAKNIHDDYTPLTLKPAKDTLICTPLVEGWNFINKSLENGMTVYNFHPKIREQKQYLYPKFSAAELQKQLSWINNIVTYAPTCVFFWNTETYIDLKYVDIKKPIEKLYSVAASFKPNMILHKFNFTPSTEVVYYDYSKPALAFKKLLIKEWNGEDYPRFLKYATDRYRINGTGGNWTEFMTQDELWQREIDLWGGEQVIKDHWEKYKTLKHSYVHCDICEDPTPLTSKVTDEENSIIWWSNAFHTVNAHYVRGLEGITNSYNTWIDQLHTKNKNLWILGKDHLDKPAEGKRLFEYVNDGKNQT
jgi:hypothetical protein